MFVGDRIYSGTKGSNVGHSYTIDTTETDGSPGFAAINGERGVQGFLTSDAEVQVASLTFGNKLQFDIDRITEFGALVKQGQASLDSATQLSVGLIGDRNDTIDSIAQAAVARLIGDNNVVIETDDGVTNNDDVASGQVLADTAKWIVISFATGKADVRFFVGGQPVATATKFDMSQYSGSLQPLFQLQKASDANADTATLVDWYVRYRDPN